MLMTQKRLNSHFRHRENVFNQHSHLVSLAVSRYTKRISRTDLNDLSQAGFLALWELIIESDVVQSAGSERDALKRLALRRIEKTIKKQRKKQLNMHHETNVFLKMRGEVVDYPSEFNIEVTERKMFVFRALQALSSDQRVKLEKAFGLYGDPTTIREIASEAGCTYEAVRISLGKMLQHLSNDPNIQSLVS
jgi:RNA polymerase sigma factor (sigma-70 family)